LRLWDARIGRWLTTDPGSQYSSPYLGMGNNPISNVDPDGGISGPGDDLLVNSEGGTAVIGLNEVVVVGKGRSAPYFWTPFTKVHLTNFARLKGFSSETTITNKFEQAYQRFQQKETLDFVPGIEQLFSAGGDLVANPDGFSSIIAIETSPLNATIAPFANWHEVKAVKQGTVLGQGAKLGPKRKNQLMRMAAALDISLKSINKGVKVHKVITLATTHGAEVDDNFVKTVNTTYGIHVKLLEAYFRIASNGDVFLSFQAKGVKNAGNVDLSPGLDGLGSFFERGVPLFK